MKDRLRFELNRALAQVGARAQPALLDELVERYAEPHRAYHTLRHVVGSLGWLEWYRSLAEHPAEIALAIWFHDAIYDPRASDNEQKSAELAVERLAHLGARSDAIHRINDYVLATAGHDAPASADGRLMIDIDLAILGARPSAFSAYDRAIRTEYRHVPWALYALGRRRILRRFLHRPILYQCAPLRELLEERARENLRRALGRS